MIKKISDVRQMEFLAKAPIYLSQGEAAEFMQVSVRNLQYWESVGLLHREGRHNGRGARYTRWDLIEINFIRSLICECGFTVNSLKAKLALLESPYYYDPDDIIWDNYARCWCSRSDIACQELNRIKHVFVSYVRQVFESIAKEDEREATQEIISILRSLVRGHCPKKLRCTDKT
ncbi:TPA: hypothetical protein DD394_07730 [bacterium UBP9_UBA11836]|nr:hypothetical protein [bacterium UBP9_UBA11836]